jgi:hypothetical protein
MSEANNWKWISSPPDYVRNLVEGLRVKGEEGAAEMFKNYVEELHFKCAENVMLEAKFDFLYIENRRLEASLEFAADTDRLLVENQQLRDENKRLRELVEGMEEELKEIGAVSWRTPDEKAVDADLLREDAHERKRLEKEYPWKE